MSRDRRVRRRAAGEAEALCLRIAAAFDHEFMARDAVVFGSCSIGGGLYREVLIANADAALYRTKSEQRRSVQFVATPPDNSLRENASCIGN
jgi:GGDEF domain-containing protein